MTEYKIHQTISPTGFVWGYLAAYGHVLDSDPKEYVCPGAVRAENLFGIPICESHWLSSIPAPIGGRIAPIPS